MWPPAGRREFLTGRHDGSTWHRKPAAELSKVQAEHLFGHGHTHAKPSSMCSSNVLPLHVGLWNRTRARGRLAGRARRRLDAAQGDRPAGRAWACSRLASGLRFCTGRNARMARAAWSGARRLLLRGTATQPRRATQARPHPTQHAARPGASRATRRARLRRLCRRGARRGCRVVRVSLAHLICGTHAPMAQKTPMSILRRDESATRATHARGRRQCCFLCCWVGGPGACTHFARRSKLSPQAELGLDGKDVMARPSPIRPDMGAHPNAFL